MVLTGFRGSLLKIALIAIPGEMVSFFLFSMFPIDVGYPPGTNPFFYVTLVGVWLHAPALLTGVDALPTGFVYPVLILSGYLNIVAISVVSLLSYRALKKLISIRVSDDGNRYKLL
jgi:hypothetical protein